MLRTSVRPPYAAYLRVYEPLAAFPEPERSYWQGYLAEWRREEPAGHPTALDEARRRLADLTAVPPTAVPERESRDAFVYQESGVAYLCPWRTRLRCWLALEQLPEELPEPLLDAAVPPVVRAQAEADWDRWRAGNPDVRPWILTSTWHVPVRWLVPFGPEDRQFLPSNWESEQWGTDDWEPGDRPAGEGEPGEGEPGGWEPGSREPARRPGEGRLSRGDDGRDEERRRDGGTTGPGEGGTGVPGAEGGEGAAKRRAAPVLRYRTAMAQARRRVARGYRVLRENLDEGPLVSGVEEIGRWLEEFHPRSMVELDYGGLVYAIPEHRLAEDDSAADVAEGIAALREGDGARAGALYRRLTDRWRRVQELQFAN